MIFAEIPWRANRARELNFRWVSDPKILCGPALRAMFKISAAPRAPLKCGDSVGAGWCVRTIQDLERFSFLFNVACRDGF